MTTPGEFLERYYGSDSKFSQFAVPPRPPGEVYSRDTHRVGQPRVDVEVGGGLPTAAASAGVAMAQATGDMARAAKDADWSKVADLAPFSPLAAIFMGPKGATNLAKARIRHRDDWGGINRLKAAENDPLWGNPEPEALRDTWKRYGWTPADTWGTHGLGPNAQPAAVLEMPNFGINPRRLQEWGDHSADAMGKVSNVYLGVENALVAEPSLKNVKARLNIDPEMRGLSGATNVKLSRGGGYRPTFITMNAPDLPGLLTGSLHELTHAGAAKQGVAPSANVLVSQSNYPLAGTEAEKYVPLLLQQVRDNEARGLTYAQPPPRTPQEMLQRIRGLAGYYNLAEEQIARLRQLMGNKTIDELKEMVPALTDTFSGVPGAERMIRPALHEYRSTPEPRQIPLPLGGPVKRPRKRSE